MRNIYKYIGLFGIMIFSFYYTEKIAQMMQNKSPIMKTINEIESKYLENPVNALINEDVIIPGVKGKKINKNKSYVNMKYRGVFNEYYLVFDDIIPEVSLEENKDKIINKGNKLKKGIALILEDNDNIKNYLIENKINASILIKEENFKKDSFLEQINNDLDNYKNIESLLNKNNLNKNICYIKNIDKEFCLKNRKYLVEETISFSNSNLIEIKKNIESGTIILIKKDVSLDNFKQLLKEISFKGLKFLTVSDLISEEN